MTLNYLFLTNAFFKLIVAEFLYSQTLDDISEYTLMLMADQLMRKIYQIVIVTIRDINQ